ncbi:hypothetical protein N9M66_02950 [Litoreibacter sp.]|nr:hypothetical protein [Litoreibacter sp.]
MTRNSRPLLAILAVAMIVSACSSRLNPVNWFGRDRAEVVETAPDANVTRDGRRFVDQVVQLAVDATPNGAIVRAVGLPLTQGYWDAELVRVNSQDPSLVVFEFRVVPPLERRNQGTEQSREIIAATSISNAALQGVRSISVVGARNRRSVRR